MKSKDAKKKRKYHEKRAEFYRKKENKAKFQETRIGFRLNKDQ